MPVLAVLFFTSCSTPTVWGHPPEIFRERLRAGTLEHLSRPSLDDAVLEEVSRLGPGAAFYLAFHPFADETMPEKLLRMEATEGEEPWARAAALELGARYTREQEYGALLELDRELGGRYDDDYAWRRLVTEAAYWDRRDREAAELLEGLHADFPRILGEDPELRLFEAVLAQRNGRAEWPRLVVGLFRDLPAGSLHIRVRDYLRIEELTSAFSAEDLRFLDAVDRTARGVRGSEARAAFEELLLFASEPEFSGPGTLASLALASGLAGSRTEALDALSRPAVGTERTAAELRARMLRDMGRHAEAGGIYADLARAATGAEAERFRWYAFSSEVRADPRAAVDALPRLLLALEDSAYYTDVLTELAGRLSAARAWDDLVRAYRFLDGAVGGTVLSRYAYLSARAVAAGISGESTDLEVSEIYRRLAAGEYPGSAQPPAPGGRGGGGEAYYRLMGAVLLDLPPEPLLPVSPPPTQPVGDADILVAGFLDFGLFDLAAENAADERVSPPTALSVARELVGLGETEAGVRLLLRRDLPAEPEAYYPRPFRDTVELSAAEEGIPAWLLYALIREESLFNPRAVSHAGARGLTQLMPATAADVARRLGIVDPDSFDPEVNLRIGSWYLDNMLERTASYADALASYNAGITRLRRWRNSTPDLPDDLFLETIPFDETREYVKRLLVSSYHYGYLYYHVDAGNVVFRFFPRL